MGPFLMGEEVAKKAKELIASFKLSGSYALPPDDSHPLSDLKEKETFGVLTARTEDGKERTLYGFSGTISGSYLVPGYVPPCLSVNKFNEVVATNDQRIHELTDLIEKGSDSLKEERKRLSNETLSKIRTLYRFRRWDSSTIVGVADGNLTGVGECAGVKLVNTALRKGWEITGLAEIQMDGTLQAPCEARCSKILPEMLGLDYIFADGTIAAINKASGMLSAPGKGPEKIDSVSYRFHKLFPSSPPVPNAHRLDMDTSGVLLLAFTKEALSCLQGQFERHEIEKTYIGLVEGRIQDNEGRIELPMRLDTSNRPYQIVDYERGKTAITLWCKLEERIHNGRTCTLVEFRPLTGRTHQIRLHASSGLNAPLIGDRLYGSGESENRLYLHAERIKFRHPITGEMMEIRSPLPF